MPDYGIGINTEKDLANFEKEIAFFSKSCYFLTFDNLKLRVKIKWTFLTPSP